MISEPSPLAESNGAVVPSLTFDRSAPTLLRQLRVDDPPLLADTTDTEAGRRVWRAAHARALAAADPTILGSYITRTAYRLVREWGRTIGVLAYDESIASLSIDKLLLAQPYGDPPSGAFAIRAYAELRRVVEPPHKHKGIPLLPSHNEHFGKIAESHAVAMRHIASFLRIADTDYGPLALPYLLKTPTNVDNWPDFTLLAQYEAVLIDEVLGELLDKGVRGATSELLRTQGITEHECRGLIKLAKFESRTRMDSEVEDDRAIISMRLEDLIARARQGLDMRVEIAAIKQLSIVQGVTRAEPEDALTEFARVVKKVANEVSDRPQLPPMVDAED